MKTLTGFIFALMILNFSMADAFADDMWSETPDLNNLETPSFVEQGRLVNSSNKIDMWAETPDLNSNSDTVVVHREKIVVNSGPANPEMYAETPNLNKVPPDKFTLQSTDDAMIAGQEKDEIMQ